MRAFEHINVKTLSEATEALKKEGAVAIAGGGDLIGALKDDIFPTYPKTVVNLKSIPGLDGIKLEDGILKIGALTTLADIARSRDVSENAPALSLAAGSASSPTLRETTTIGGNLCQLPRCWYFRKLNNRFDCARKGGEKCYALNGENRYHSVFGGESFTVADGSKRVCVAVNQCELAPPLAAMGARLVTTEREMPCEEFFAVGVLSSTVLRKGELLTQIHIPLTKLSDSCGYKRFAFRKSIEFPLINLSIAGDETSNYRIFIGGVAPLLYRAVKAEELLKGRELTEELAEAAGVAAAADAKPFEANSYKVQLIKTLVKRQLIAKI